MIATRLLLFQLVMSIPLMAWAIPVALRQGAVGVVLYTVGQVALQVGLVAWRDGPLWLRGGLASFSYAASGIAMLMAGDPAGATLYMLTGVVLSVVLLGTPAAVLLVVVDAVLLGARAAGWLKTAPSPIMLDDAARAAVLVLIWLVATAIVVTSIRFLLRQLRASIVDLMANNEQLRREADEKARALDVVREAQLKLVEAGKVELLSRLSAGLAHDMNNALTLVLAEAAMLDDETSADSITSAVQHAATLTRQLLALGRRDAVQPRPIDVSDVVAGVVRMVRRSWPSEVLIEERLAEGCVAIADPNQIRQIVLNLATNARDAMHSGGRLTVQVVAAEHVVITVADTGTGMDEATLARIFEPFFTTKPESRGSGLGLASVRAVVEALGGHIECESTVGVGSQFTVRLPRSSASPAQTAMNRFDADEVSLSGRRMLVVDDDLQLRALSARTLSRVGASVRDAGSAGAAIRLAEAETFDLVVTDVMMPEGGAAPLLAWLGEHRPDVPIVICTGYADDEEVRRAIGLGRYLLVQKPFGRTDLLRACVASLRGVREAPPAP